MIGFAERTFMKNQKVMETFAVEVFWQARMTDGMAVKTSVWCGFGCCKSIKLVVVASLIYLSCLL
jgi:hypothetical protein